MISTVWVVVSSVVDCSGVLRQSRFNQRLNMTDRVDVELDSDGRSDDSGGFMDDDVDDYDLNPLPEDKARVVPPLPLLGVGHGLLPPRGNPSGSGTRVDLLSEAFCFDQELMNRAMTERGMTTHGVVTAAFERSLRVPRHQLKLYHLNEITSPSQLQEKHHIAVSIQSSEFSLDAMEDLIRERGEGRREAESQRRRLNDYEERVQKLENLLAGARQELATKDAENRRLLQEIEALKQTLRPVTPSQLSSSSLSPRILPPGGPTQPHLMATVMRLQQAVTDNQQLVSDVSRAARQVVEHAYM